MKKYKDKIARSLINQVQKDTTILPSVVNTLKRVKNAKIKPTEVNDVLYNPFMVVCLAHTAQYYAEQPYRLVFMSIT